MSSPNDSAGRIHKRAFMISTLVLFIVCLLSVFARFFIRFRIQKQIGIDDVFLLFGTGCLIAAMALLFHYVDKMFMVEALLFRLPDASITSNFIEDSFWYHKMANISLELTWCSLIAVKFSFLFLFKKLVNRIQPMLVYWWFVAIFNAIVSAYGAAVYFAACPHIYSRESFECGVGSKVNLLFNFALSQMIVDIAGDLLILYIPCRLIWKIEVKCAQKLALASTLCLTIVVIICTVFRAAGIRSNNRVDIVWETYWQYIAASTGLSMTAATAFRSLFISHRSDPRRRQQQYRSRRSWSSYMRKKLAPGRKLFRWSRLSKSRSSKDISTTTFKSLTANRDLELGTIERGTITGLRSFIRDLDRTKAATASQIMRSQTFGEGSDHDDNWPLSGKVVASECRTCQGHNLMLAFDEAIESLDDSMVPRPEKAASNLNGA